MGIIGDFFDELGGDTSQDNRFLNNSGRDRGTQVSVPNQDDGVPFRGRTNPAQRTQQGENAPTRKKLILEGEAGTENPDTLRPSERQRQQSGKTTAQRTSGEGIKPLQQELKKFDRQDLEETFMQLQGQPGQKKVFGSSLTVAQAKEVIQKELKGRK